MAPTRALTDALACRCILHPQDFSKYGRVEYFLQQRLRLLNEVQRLAYRCVRVWHAQTATCIRPALTCVCGSTCACSLGVPGDHGYTAETAGHFFELHVKPRWEDFLAKLAGTSPRKIAVPPTARVIHV